MAAAPQQLEVTGRRHGTPDRRKGDRTARACPTGLALDIISTQELGSVALTWLEQDHRSRVILGRDLTLIWANRAARSALASRRDIEIRGGVLGAVHPGHQQVLQDFVLGSGSRMSSFCLPRRDGDGHLVVSSERIEAAGIVAFGVTFVGTGSDFEAAYADVRSAFGLTTSEHRVLMDLLSGTDAEGIAKACSVSIETTRSHIRSLYSKLNVKSREGLFSKVAPFRL